VAPQETSSAPPKAADVTLERMAEADGYNAWLLERARPYLGSRVLDVGAGIGTFTELLAESVDQVVALEPDELHVDGLRERLAARPNVTVLAADASTLPPPADDEAFDAAVCFNVLEHIPDDVGTLRRLRTQLRPGGRLLLLVPAHQALFGSLDRALDHCRRYGRRSLAAKLAEAGFEIEKLRHVNPVGAVGWLLWSRVFRVDTVPKQPLQAYDRLVPLLRVVDGAPVPFGLSLWAVARRPE